VLVDVYHTPDVKYEKAGGKSSCWPIPNRGWLCWHPDTLSFLGYRTYQPRNPRGTERQHDCSGNTRALL